MNKSWNLKISLWTFSNSNEPSAICDGELHLLVWQCVLFLMLHTLTPIVCKFHFPTANCFYVALRKPVEWYLSFQVRTFIVNLFGYTDLAKIWQRGLIIASYSKSEAIFGIRARYQVEISYFRNFR